MALNERVWTCALLALCSMKLAIFPRLLYNSTASKHHKSPMHRWVRIPTIIKLVLGPAPNAACSTGGLIALCESNDHSFENDAVDKLYETVLCVGLVFGLCTSRVHRTGRPQMNNPKNVVRCCHRKKMKKKMLCLTDLAQTGIAMVEIDLKPQVQLTVLLSIWETMFIWNAYLNDNFNCQLTHL